MPVPNRPSSVVRRSSARRRGPSAALLAALSAGLGGCMVGLDYAPPDTVAPPDFREAHLGPTSKPAEHVDLTVWWHSFHDRELDSLIARAVRNNNTLLQAEMSVRQARAQLGIAWGNEFPTLGLTGSASRSQTSRSATGVGQSTGTTTTGTGSGTGTGGTTTGAGGTTGGTTGTGGTTTGTGGTTGSGTSGTTNTNTVIAGATPQRQIELYRAGFDVGWEVDVFGGNRRQIEQYEDLVESQVNARRFALVTLTAEVARDYVLLRGYQLQLRYAHSNLNAEQGTLDLTQSRFHAGLTSDLDVAQAQASVAQTAATIPGFEIQIKQTMHALGILLGLDPMALTAELGDTSSEQLIPPTPSEVPVGLPSELLRRRPDVRQAERLLAAQTASIGVAVSQLFPKFSLTGSIGQQSTRFGLVARDASTIWNWGPQVSWQLLDYWQLRDQVRAANAQQAQALYAYRQIVLQSFSDVEDALVAYSNDQARTKSLQDEVDANQRAVTLSTQLYRRGIGTFLNVLTAERNLFAAQNDLAVSQSNVSTDLVQLYKALGGGWDETHEEMFHANEDPSLPVVMN